MSVTGKRKVVSNMYVMCVIILCQRKQKLGIIATITTLQKIALLQLLRTQQPHSLLKIINHQYEK
jgi:hypothetical protein